MPTAINFDLKVKEVIASLSAFSVEEINNSDKLTKFISQNMAQVFITKLKFRFRKADENELANTLYVTVKKVQDLINKIQSYY